MTKSDEMIRDIREMRKALDRLDRVLPKNITESKPYSKFVASFQLLEKKNVDDIEEIIISLKDIQTQLSDVLRIYPEIEKNPDYSVTFKDFKNAFNSLWAKLAS